MESSASVNYFYTLILIVDETILCVNSWEYRYD